MKFRVGLLSVAAILFLSPFVRCQNITGSSTFYVDSSTNTVYALCRTETDDYTEGYYESVVSCAVKDSSGNIVASGTDDDHYGRNGFADVTLTFVGIPGTVYTVTGRHVAFPTLPFDDPEETYPSYYDDVYNFTSLDRTGETIPVYDCCYSWFGPGPDIQVPSRRTITMGDTKDTIALPLPVTITFTGQSNKINDTSQMAVVGQPIQLTATYTLPSGVTVTSTGNLWTVPGTTIGGYSASVNRGVLTNATYTNNSTTFYWSDSDSNARNVVFSLQLSNGVTASATVPFVVAGPTSPSIATQLTSWNVTVGPSGGAGFSFGFLPSFAGITFTPTLTQPSGYSGAVTFVQKINSISAGYTYSSAPTSSTCPYTTGLDTTYPYSFPRYGSTYTNDSPFLPFRVNSNMIEPSTASYAVGATMYLFWTPNVSNAIPVPQGYVYWSASGNAVFNQGIYSANGTSSAQQFVADNGYPTWTQQADVSGTCQ